MAIAALAFSTACEREIEPAETAKECIDFEVAVTKPEIVKLKSIGSSEETAPVILESETGRFGLNMTCKESEVWMGTGSVKTKGMMDDNESFNEDGTFSLFESHLPANNVRYYAVSHIWATADKLEWPGEGTLNFNAIAPYKDNYSFNTTSKVLTYEVLSNFDNQNDLMMAESRNISGAYYGKVFLYFHHCLSAIRFETADDINCSINSITLSGINSFGKFSVVYPTENPLKGVINSELANSNTSSYTFTAEAPVSTPNTDILGENKAFLLVPQTLGANAKVQAECTIGGETVTVQASLTGIQWKPGYTYTYTLSPKCSGLYFTLADEEDREIFASWTVPSPRVGVSGTVAYETPAPFDGFEFLRWEDSAGNVWGKSGGNFNRSIPANTAVYLHPVWKKTSTNQTLMRGKDNSGNLKFTNILSEKIGSSTDVVFGNWSTYGSTVGGSFDSGTKVGDSKYDEIRIFNKGTTTYILAKDASSIILHENCDGLFQGRNTITGIDLRSVVTTNVKKMANMFNECSNLTRILVDSNWSTASVTDSGTNMFASCSKLTGDWGSHVTGQNVEYAKPDGPQESDLNSCGYLSLTTNKYYKIDKNTAHSWVKAALNAGAHSIHFGAFNDFKDGNGKVGNRTWQENVEAQGLGFSGGYFNTDAGSHTHGNPCKNSNYHHIADFFASTNDGWVLAEGDGIIAFVGDFSGFLKGDPYDTKMNSLEFVNVDTRYVTNFPWTDKVVTR